MAVTEMEIASVVHQMAIQAVVASTAVPAKGRPSGRNRTRTRVKARGPRIRPIFFVVIYMKLPMVSMGR
jgi:hypothetical protein